MAYKNHWLPGFNFNVEEWFEGEGAATSPYAFFYFGIGAWAYLPRLVQVHACYSVMPPIILVM
jgi:hypothetical protein